MSLIALHYELKEKIGSGSFGTVYSVEDIATKKTFAVKIFDKIPIEDIREKMNPKVMREITKISHPNLIKICDYGIYQNNLYLLSEFYESRGLQNFHLNEKNKQEFFELVTQICYALNHLHSHHIIHKDMKLENVLYKKIGDEINVKVCDYGFNKIISQTEAYPEGEVVSLPYIAPELLQGSYFTPKSDFYALGVIMYYLSTGTFPFSREEIKLMSEKKIPNIIPQFPTKINPEVDKKLEDLIFHLIEFNPTLRIRNTQEIICYINEMQDKKFPLTIEPPLVEQIESKQLHFREKDIITLRDQINEIKNMEGKIIFVTGEKGVGKSNLMQYIKWYILSEDYHVFYYNCSDQHRDPFFMLCKEIFLSQDEKGKHFFEQSASNKFCEFLFESEEKSLKIIEDESDLMRDYELVKEYIYCFSSTKPIVYFITNIDKVDESTINFLKYISADLPNYPIAIIASSYNPYIVETAHKIHIEPLSRTESSLFINEILGEECPEKFLDQMYMITNGNQRFILELIAQLIEKKIILDDEENWYFNVNILDVKLPQRIKAVIEEKIALIPDKIKNLLAQLSILQVPLSTKIIQTILHFTDSKDLFFFMQDVETLDILVKNEDYADEGYFKFIYPALKSELSKKLSIARRKQISREVIHYFKVQQVTKPAIMDGIITHCELVKDYESEIHYYLLKTVTFIEHKNIIEAWNSCYKGLLKINEIKDKLKAQTVQDYLKVLLTLSILLNKGDLKNICCDQYAPFIRKNPDLLLLNSRYQMACRSFTTAEKALIALQKSQFTYDENDILLAQLELYNLSHEEEKANKVLQTLIEKKLTPLQEINFYLYRGDYFYSIGTYEKAIVELKKAQKIAKSQQAFTQLGRILKVLGDSYNILNKVERAIRHYEEAAAVSSREGDILNKANVLSHWGYLNMKQGALRAGLEKSLEALTYFKKINFTPGMAEVNLNIAQTQLKLGDFREAERHFYAALSIAKELKYTELIDKIYNRSSFLKLRILSPAKFLAFLHNHCDYYFKKHTIENINSYLKNYCFWLVISNNHEKLKSIYKMIIKEKIDTSLEMEFMHQLEGWLALGEENYSKAVSNFKKAGTLAKKNQNEYALTMSYLNIADTYYIAKDLKQSEIYCEQAHALAVKNEFSRWDNYTRVLEAKIMLRKADMNLRTVIRKLLKAETIAKKMKDWNLQCESLILITLIYKTLHLKNLEYKFKRKYYRKLNVILRGISEDDKERIKNVFHFDTLQSSSKMHKIIEPRAHVSPAKLQHYFFDLLHLSSVNQIRFNLKKYILEVVGIDKFGIILYENKDSEGEFWISNQLTKDELTSIHQNHFEKLRTELECQYYTVKNQHFCLAPLKLKNELEGVFILADMGEYPFTKSEKLIIKLSGLYLTIILKKIGEYEEVLEQRKQLSNLITISRDILQIMNLEELKNQITLNAIKLSGAERGFFINLDENKNFVFDVALLSTGEKIDRDNLKISKTVLKDVYESKVPLSTFDAVEERRFSDSESIQRNDLRSVYCSPLNVHNEIYGFLYLDNLTSINKVMRFNEKLLEIFILMAETAIKNSLDYEKLHIANQELLKIDQERAQFINISSHEFNTPIQTLKGYISILKDPETPDNVRQNTINIMDRNVDRLLNAINNILQMNALETRGIQFEKELIDPEDILKIVYEETHVLAEKRKQKLILKIAKGLKPIMGERMTLINGIKNLVLNAIKYTDDYGEIIIGARKSRFRKEEADNKESLIIYIKDTGIGIPSYELDNIFREFYEVADIKAHHSGVTEFKSSGLGLGLPITKTIVEHYDGKMWVTSVKGEGSTFFISLPFAKKQLKKKSEK